MICFPNTALWKISKQQRKLEEDNIIMRENGNAAYCMELKDYLKLKWTTSIKNADLC